jgi:cadmium resistance protein CadD (predicted permease)
MLETLTIGAALFASTNIDDIFLLMAFFSDPRLDRRAVVAGQYAGIGALVAASVLAAACAVAVPGHWIALLGLAPLAIGLHRLWSSWRGGEGANADDDTPRPAGSGFIPQVCSVAGVTAANGGDNIGVYVPVFAQDFGAVPLLCAVFAALTGVWCVAGHLLVNHRLVASSMRRLSGLLLPYVLIGLGLWILRDAIGLVMPASG